MAKHGKPKRIKTPARLMQLWEDYKTECRQTRTEEEVEETYTDLTTGNSTTTARMIKRRTPVTPTWTGFAGFIGMSRNGLDQIYRTDPEFSETIQIILDEQEQIARRAFETGTLNAKLAPLWMSRHGYTLKQDVSASVTADDDETAKAMQAFFSQKKAQSDKAEN